MLQLNEIASLIAVCTMGVEGRVGPKLGSERLLNHREMFEIYGNIELQMGFLSTVLCRPLFLNEELITLKS